MHQCIEDYRKERRRIEALLELAALAFFMVAMVTMIPWSAIASQMASALADNRSRFAVLTGIALGLGITATIMPSVRTPRSLKWIFRCAINGGSACGVDEELERFIKRVKDVWRNVAVAAFVVILSAPMLVAAAPTDSSSYSSVEIHGVILPSDPSYAVITWGNASKSIKGIERNLDFQAVFDAEYIREDINITVYGRGGEVLFHAAFEPSPIGYALVGLRVAKGTVFDSNAAIIIKEPVFRLLMTLTTSMPIGNVNLRVNGINIAYNRSADGIMAEWIGSPSMQHVVITSESEDLVWEVVMNTSIPGHGNVEISAKLIVLKNEAGVTEESALVKLIPFKQVSVTVLNLSSSNSVGQKVFGEGTFAHVGVISGASPIGESQVITVGETAQSSSQSPELSGQTSQESTTAQIAEQSSSRGSRASELSGYVFMAGVVAAFIGVIVRKLPWSVILTAGGLAAMAYSMLFMT